MIGSKQAGMPSQALKRITSIIKVIQVRELLVSSNASNCTFEHTRMRKALISKVDETDQSMNACFELAACSREARNAVLTLARYQSEEEFNFKWEMMMTSWWRHHPCPYLIILYLRHVVPHSANLTSRISNKPWKLSNCHLHLTLISYIFGVFLMSTFHPLVK